MDAGAPLDREEFRRWLAEAERALESAKVQADAELHNWSCFAAEQSAQLAIEGLLHGVGRGPWGHDLVGLGAAAADVDPEGRPANTTAVQTRTKRSPTRPPC